MADFARDVEIHTRQGEDRELQSLYIEGQHFPYFIAKDGIEVESAEYPGYSILTLKLYVEGDVIRVKDGVDTPVQV